MKKRNSTEVEVEKEQVPDINIELVEEINELLEHTVNDNLSAVKIKRINDYISTSYPELQSDFEKRFPKAYGLNGFKNHIYILQNILMDVLHKKINNENFYKLSEEDVQLGKNFIETIFQYLSNKIDLNETKNKIFLIAHEVDASNFTALNQNGLFSLCEMSERGIDVNEYAQAGNLRLNFLNDVANGKFKTKTEEALKKQKIIETIENCLSDGCIEEIEYNSRFSLIFEPSSDGVSIFTNSNLENPIAEINENGDFIKGSLNIVLITIYKNIDNRSEERSKTANTIDNIISKYNEVSTEQQAGQPDLATALRLALGLGNQSDTNSDNSSN